MPRVITGRYFLEAGPCSTAFAFTGQGSATDTGILPLLNSRIAISADGSTAYVASYVAAGSATPKLLYFDITGAVPSYLGYINLTAYPFGTVSVGDIKRYGDRLYIITNGSLAPTPYILNMVDISAPASPAVVANYSTVSNWGLYGHQVTEIGGARYIFIYSPAAGLVRVYDVTGDGMTYVSQFGSADGSLMAGSDLVGNYLYIIQYDYPTWSGETWVEIWNISNPAAVVLASNTPHVSPPAWFNPATDNYGVELCATIGNVCALASYYTDASGPYYLEVMDAFDVTNHAAATHIGQCSKTDVVLATTETTGSAPQAAKWGDSVILTLRNALAVPAFNAIQPYCIPAGSILLGTHHHYIADGFLTGGNYVGAPCEVSGNVLVLAGHLAAGNTEVLRRYTVS